MSKHVITAAHGRIGRVVLDRQRALNALDASMIAALAAALEAWRAAPEVHAITIEGAGERAFCAGGDIRAVRDAALAGDAAAIEAFFSAEYALNLAIARYPKPYVALIDGFCMGGASALPCTAPTAWPPSMRCLPCPRRGLRCFRMWGRRICCRAFRAAWGCSWG